MRDSMRLYATMFIWIAFTVMTAVLFTTSSRLINDYDVIPLLGILAGTALFSTVAIWITAGRGQTPVSSSAQRAQAKRKRVDRERMERLIAAMDEDEIAALESVLMAHDDGEQRSRYQS